MSIVLLQGSCLLAVTETVAELHHFVRTSCSCCTKANCTLPPASFQPITNYSHSFIDFDTFQYDPAPCSGSASASTPTASLLEVLDRKPRHSVRSSKFVTATAILSGTVPRAVFLSPHAKTGVRTSVPAVNAIAST